MFSTVRFSVTLAPTAPQFAPVLLSTSFCGSMNTTAVSLLWMFMASPSLWSKRVGCSGRLIYARRLGRARGGRRCAAADALAQPLEDDVEHRDDEDAERRGGDHAAEDRRADRAAAGGAGADRDDEGQQAEDEGEARHHDRAE